MFRFSIFFMGALIFTLALTSLSTTNAQIVTMDKHIDQITGGTPELAKKMTSDLLALRNEGPQAFKTIAPHSVREMKQYGILPKDLPADAPIDVYANDRAYWQSLWYKPQTPPVAQGTHHSTNIPLSSPR